VIIDDLDPMCVPILPDEADAISVVDPNAVLAGALVFQCLKRIAGRAKVGKYPGSVKLKSPTNCGLLDGHELPRPHSEKDLLCFGVSKRTDHHLIVYR